MRKNILIGICGGIASYKTAQLVRLLVTNGAAVKVMMTPAATQFVTPLVFQTLSTHPVYTDMFALHGETTQHISLADWADICVIAPLSANTLSKIANGICDNLLTTVVCALPAQTKVLLAAAMNENMWKNTFIKENIKKLKKHKQFFLMVPEKGELACGAWGQGRMPEADAIYKKIRSLTA